jgi:predicted transglutaminase-like cysteine proteinase
MGLGVAAAAPTGYLDFCQRQPEDCGGAPPAVVRKVAEVELARRNASEAQLILAGGRRTTTAAFQGRNVNWGNAFAEARLRREAAELSNAALEAALAEAQPAGLPAPRLMTVSTATPAGEARLQRLGEGSLTAQSPPSAEQAASDDVQRAAMTAALWSQLNRINDKVNRQIVRRADIQTYGVLDRWATPLAAGDNLGDCEDYVLEKRRALIAAGLPASALSIAVATTSWGESHAVLLVATDQGDYVLDSLTPWILPWRKASLTWRERQVAGAPFRWAMVNTSLTVAPLTQPLTSPAPVADQPVEVAPTPLDAGQPLRLLRTEAFTGRPNGVTSPTPAAIGPAEEPTLSLTLAQLGAGGPLRGRLH